MNLTFYTVDRFCSEIDVSHNELLIDLSEVEFITQFALVYLGLFIRSMRKSGFLFKVIQPQNLNVANYLRRQGFFKRFDINGADYFPEISEYTVAMADIESNPGLPDDYSEKLKSLLINLKVNIDIGEFCEISSEILDNFVRHSEDQYGLIAFQYYGNKKHFRICFGDCGVGFRKSLSKNSKYRYLLKETSAVSIGEAIKEGISRFEGRRGSGLAMLIEYILKYRGELFITSEDGYFRLDSAGVPRMGEMKYSLPGVQIEFQIPEAE